VTYLITFSCYGTHLHGDPTGSVDRAHNLWGARFLATDSERALTEEVRMSQLAYRMDRPRRAIVLQAIRDRCSANRWNLLAAHVRSNHVHIVLDAEVQPNRVMTDLKAYASRSLNEHGLDSPSCRRWTRHGSTGWPWGAASISAAIRYVVEDQGEPLAVFQA